MPTNVTIAGVNTPETLVATSSNFLPKLWKQGAELSEQEGDFFSEFEGTGPESPVIVATDTAKGAGSTINYRNIAGLYGNGVVGNDSAAAAAEQLRTSDYSVSVDFFRHCTELNIRTDEQTAMKGELKNKVNTSLGLWVGRKKTKHMFKTYQHKGNAENTLFANNKGSREALRTADVVSMDNIISLGQVMKTAGARPAMIGKVGRNPVHRMIVVATGEALVALKTASDYKQAVRDGGVRGMESPVFKGGFVDLDGHVIREYNPFDHDGFGPIGSPLNPRAVSGTAIAAGTVAFNIDGGGSAAAAAITTAYYFEDFSNYAFTFRPDDIVTAGTTDRYCIIYNVSGASAGKWGFYKYVTNTGRVLTVSGRLAAAVSGIAHTTVGNVTWSGTLNTDAHPSGSIVIETNSYGVPIGRSLILGARSVLRGYGSLRNQRSEQALEGGFYNQTYITSVFGQSPVPGADGRMRNFRVVEHALAYQGLNLPTIS